jgi:hypothetical protein
MQCPQCGRWNDCPGCTSYLCEFCGWDLNEEIKKKTVVERVSREGRGYTDEQTDVYQGRLEKTRPYDETTD